MLHIPQYLELKGVYFFVSYELPRESAPSASTYEYEDELMMPEIDEARKSTFENRHYPTVLGCGDDRGITPESIKFLISQGLPMEHPYLRYFGGIFGVSRTVLVTIGAQYGRQRLAQAANGGYFGFTRQLAEGAREHGVYMISHSADGTEGGPREIRYDLGSDIACAYAAGMGGVSTLSARDQMAIRVAQFESQSCYGRTESNSNFGHIVKGNEIFMGLLGNDPAGFKITRRDLARTNTLGMMLHGGHAINDPEEGNKVKHALNFTRDMVSNPLEANRLDVPYYDNDVTQVAELIIKTMPELQLDPAILLDAMMLDASATRKSLASLDGPADPQRLESVRLGDPKEALEYLRSLY